VAGAEAEKTAYRPEEAKRLFEREPGVLTSGEGDTRYRRGYRTMRIPESVMIRVDPKYRTRN